MKRRIQIFSITLVLTLLLSVSMMYIGNATQGAYPTTHENTYKNTGNQQNDIIEVAKTQIGYQEGKGSGYENATKYGAWMTSYTNSNYMYTAWCGMFIAWCANQAGIPKSVVPYCAGSNSLAKSLPSGNIHYYNSGYTPQKGDIAFLSNSSQNARSFDHVGLVESVSADGKFVTTIEGNLTNKVQRVTRPIKGFYWGQTIAAFGTPKYQTRNSETTTSPETVTQPETTTSKVSVKSVKLSESEIRLNVGETKTLKAIVTPENAANKSVTFSSSDENVAKVSKEGVVSGMKDGNAIITVKTVDGGFSTQVKTVVLSEMENTTVESTKAKKADDTKDETTTHVSETTTKEVTTNNEVLNEKTNENTKSDFDGFAKIIKMFLSQPTNSILGLILVYISKSFSLIK